MGRASVNPNSFRRWMVLLSQGSPYSHIIVYLTTKGETRRLSRMRQEGVVSMRSRNDLRESHLCEEYSFLLFFELRQRNVDKLKIEIVHRQLPEVI